MLLSHVLETPLLASRELSAAKRRRGEKAGARGELSGLSIAELAEEARARCGAQSAGVSLFRRADPIASEWIVARGVLSAYQGSSFPLRHSLCGVAADLHSTQLFIKPQLYFKWLDHAGVYISEALVTPLADASGRCFGTVWTMSHRGTRPRFDEGDAQALEAIAGALALTLLPTAEGAGSGAVLPNRSSRNGFVSRRLSIDATGPSEEVIPPGALGV